MYSIKESIVIKYIDILPGTVVLILCKFTTTHMVLPCDHVVIYCCNTFGANNSFNYFEKTRLLNRTPQEERIITFTYFQANRSKAPSKAVTKAPSFVLSRS